MTEHSTLLVVTDETNDSVEVYLIPAGPIAALAAKENGTQYEFPNEDDFDDAAEYEDAKNESVESIYEAIVDPKNRDWHQGNWTDGVLALPFEPVRVSHIYLNNTP